MTAKKEQGGRPRGVPKGELLSGLASDIIRGTFIPTIDTGEQVAYAALWRQYREAFEVQPLESAPQRRFVETSVANLAVAARQQQVQSLISGVGQEAVQQVSGVSDPQAGLTNYPQAQPEESFFAAATEDMVNGFNDLLTQAATESRLGEITNG